MKICIDAGHNNSGWDTGAQGCGIREQDITFSVAHKTAELLRKLGFDVLETRPTKETNLGTNLNLSLQARCDMANAWGADYFVSIHCNSFLLPTPKGTETYIISKGGQAEQLAQKVQEAVVGQVGTANRGVKVQNLKVLRSTNMPAILVELAYICTPSDAELLKTRKADFAQGIFEGICRQCGISGQAQETKNQTGPQTVMHLDNIWVQDMEPIKFGIYAGDKKKRDFGVANYFNLGYFAQEKKGTIPVGNLADCGNILSQSKDNPDWINVAGKELTTLIVHQSGMVGMMKTKDLDGVPNLKTAVSGIPIIRKGQRVSMDEIQSEGYFGNECYKTWHGFLGIRNNRLLYVAAKYDFEMMYYILSYLGIEDGIKVDGGGSFILVNGYRELVGTEENRRINNIGMWEE